MLYFEYSIHSCSGFIWREPYLNVQSMYGDHNLIAQKYVKEIPGRLFRICNSTGDLTNYFLTYLIGFAMILYCQLID